VEDPDKIKFLDWLNQIKGLSRISTSKVSNKKTDREYTIIGKVTALRIIQTKKGQWMAFSQLKDSKGYIGLVIFPKIWKQHGIYLRSHNIMGISGIIDVSYGVPKFLVGNVLRLDEIQELNNSEIHKKMNRKGRKKI